MVTVLVVVCGPPMPPVSVEDDLQDGLTAEVVVGREHQAVQGRIDGTGVPWKVIVASSRAVAGQHGQPVGAAEAESAVMTESVTVNGSLLSNRRRRHGSGCR